VIRPIDSATTVAIDQFTVALHLVDVTQLFV